MKSGCIPRGTNVNKKLMVSAPRITREITRQGIKRNRPTQSENLLGEPAERDSNSISLETDNSIFPSIYNDG